MSAVARLLAGLAAVLALGFGAQATASAHAVLVATDPAYGATIDAVPHQVSMTFDEPVTAAANGVTVADGSGVRADSGAVSTVDGGRRVLVGLRPGLSDGTYLLSWTVLSADGHTIGGSTIFGIGVPADLSLREPPRDPWVAAADTVVRLLAALGYLGMVAAVGIPAVALLVWRAGLRAPGPIQLIRVGAVTVAVASVLIYALTPVRLLGVAGWTDPRLWWQAAVSSVGASALVRAAAATLLALGARRPRIVLAADLVIVLATATSGHAMAGADRPIALVSTVLHLIAVSSWVAGPVLAVLVWRRADRAGLLRGFGGVALGAVAVLTVTGGYQSLRSVGPLDALWTTSWGRLLIVKVALVAVALAVAVLLRRAGSRTAVALRVELAVQLAVLAVTAALAGVAPARDTYDPAVTLTADAGPVRADVAVDGARAGKQEFTVRLRDAGGTPIGAAGVTGRLTRADGRLGPVDVPLRRVDPIELGPNYFVSGAIQVPLAGDWQLQLTVLTDRSTGYTMTLPYRVW